jgi:hypothetical protein
MRLIRRAASIRRRAIASNRGHPEDETPRMVYSKDLKRRMPAKYRHMLHGVLRTRGGKAALAKFRKFWGIPYPTELLMLPGNLRKPLVGMGRTPEVVLADSPGGRTRKLRGSWTGAFDPSGRQIFLLTKKGLPKRPQWKFVGYAAETHYVPTKGMEMAGSFKRGKYWVHEHSDEGGSWPKVYRDQNGNFRYGRGTYHIGKWIRR